MTEDQQEVKAVTLYGTVTHWFGHWFMGSAEEAA